MARKKKKVIKNKNPHTVDSIQIVTDVLAMGHNTQEAKTKLIAYRKEKKQSINPQLIDRIIGEVSRNLRDEYGKDKNHVMALHIERYNHDIINILSLENHIEKAKEADELGEQYEFPDGFDFGKTKMRLINRYFDALSTILQKEKVLQMHSNGFLVSIVNNLNIEKKEKKQYDLSKLTFEQKIDFLNLLLKSKKNDFEVGSVILRSPDVQQKTIDIVHEVIEEGVNIDKIKHEEQPPAIPMQTGTAIYDVNQKLAETLKKRAEEAYRNAGSKTVGKIE